MRLPVRRGLRASDPHPGGDRMTRRSSSAANGEWLVRVTRLRLQRSETLAEDAAAFAWLELCRVQPERNEHLPVSPRVVALHAGYRLLGKEAREPLAEDVCKQERGADGGGQPASNCRPDGSRSASSSTRSSAASSKWILSIFRAPQADQVNESARKDVRRGAPAHQGDRPLPRRDLGAVADLGRARAIEPRLARRRHDAPDRRRDRTPSPPAARWHRRP